MCTLCSVQCTPCTWDPVLPPPRIWAHIRGRYWSAKIYDISLWPPVCNDQNNSTVFAEFRCWRRPVPYFWFVLAGKSKGKSGAIATLAPRLSHRVSENIPLYLFLCSLVTNRTTFLFSFGCLFLNNLSGNPGFLNISDFLVFPKHCLGMEWSHNTSFSVSETKDVLRNSKLWSVSFAWGVM